MNPNSTAPKSAEILLAKARHPVGFGVKRTCPFVLFAVYHAFMGKWPNGHVLLDFQC